MPNTCTQPNSMTEYLVMWALWSLFLQPMRSMKTHQGHCCFSLKGSKATKVKDWTTDLLVCCWCHRCPQRVTRGYTLQGFLCWSISKLQVKFHKTGDIRGRPQSEHPKTNGPSAYQHVGTTGGRQKMFTYGLTIWAAVLCPDNLEFTPCSSSLWWDSATRLDSID